MTDQELKGLCEEVCNVVKTAGNFIREEKVKFRFEQKESKGVHDFVTYVDKRSEEILVNKLHMLLPEAGFLAEEGTGSKKKGKYNWIIDPLDGTTNFIHGLPPFAISIALSDSDKIVTGVIYEVSFDECFYAWKNSPAYLNGEVIQTTKIQTLNDALIATGFPYTNYTRIKEYLETLEFFMKHTHGLRRIGSAATDLAYVACGRFDAFYEYSLKPWDVAAGAFLVQQAGGRISDFRGGNDYLFGQEIIAGGVNIFPEMLRSIKEIMKHT